MSLLENVVIVIIGGSAADRFSIKVTDRSKDWIQGTLEISAGPWSGTCGCSFYRGDLCQFASDLEKLYKDLAGVAHRLSAGTCLEFTMALDQTELPAIASGLRMADPPT